MKENACRDKAYEFALDIVKFCRRNNSDRTMYSLIQQILRSGTSVGANIEEAQQAQSKKDFASKFSIAVKEAYETRYWLRIFRDTKLIDENELNPLLIKIDEIIRLLVASIKTIKL